MKLSKAVITLILAGSLVACGTEEVNNMVRHGLGNPVNYAKSRDATNPAWRGSRRYQRKNVHP